MIEAGKLQSHFQSKQSYTMACGQIVCKICAKAKNTMYGMKKRNREKQRERETQSHANKYDPWSEGNYRL